LQVAADRKTSSYVLCRDGRQAQLLADPSPTMTPTPGGRARDATSSQGIVPDSSPPRRHGANGAHRPGPGPAALHPPPHPTDPACSRPEVAPAAPAEPGRHVPRCRPEPPRRRQPGPCAPPHRPARRAFYRLIRRLGVNRREIAAHDQLIGGTSRIRVASAAMADDSFVMGAGGVPARPRRAPRGALQCCHVRSRCRACRLA
jgi:hypothetical protein